MKKRVLSLFLALMLCLTLLPTAAFAEGETGSFTVDGEPYEGTFADALAESPAEIVLYKNVTISEDEDGTVYSELTINMNGHSIIGNIDVTENLTLENGTVNGTIKVDGGTLNMTAPETAEAAITKGLNVISGSAYVSGAKIGVKGTLYFDSTDMIITGTEQAVELTAAAEPSSKKLYGSTDANGETAEEATFVDGTYQVSGVVAKKLSSKQEGSTVTPEPSDPTLTLTPETADVAAGETATFTVTYDGTDKLNVYVQGSSLDEYFTFNQTNNGDGSYTVSVEIAKETPAGKYTLYVHEMENTSVQAKAAINVISTVAKDNEGTYYTTIKDAIEKATDGSTITVIAAENRISLPDGIYVKNQTGITLDLNGHSLDGCSLNVGGLTATSQVRTGKLTVVDSSGGNGAVGVTVRDGGKVEFRGSIATSCLRLQVYGGDVKFYGGNIRSFDLYNSVTYADFLPEGYCYYNYSGSGSDLGSIVTAADVANAVNVGRYLAVAPCSHGGANGFDGTNCPYCNAPAVAETALNNGEGNRPWRRFADLQTALDADRGGGAEFKLLADVTGDYTINGTQDTGLDLNGHSIKGTVTVKAAAGSNTTTLSNTKNTTTASIDVVVAHRGAKLAGSGKPAVIGELTLAEGATWKDILQLPNRLGFRVTSADGTYKWYAPNDVNGSQLNNVIINSLPITTKNLAFKVNGTSVNGKKVERGTTVQLCADCNANGATVEFSVLKKGETTPITLSGSDVKYTTVGTGTTKFYVAEYTFNDVGSYTISFTATKDGYTVQSNAKMLTVTKPNLSKAEITFRSSNESTYEPYNATTTAPGFTVTYNGKTLKLGVDYTASGTASSAGVSTQTLTIKAVEGSDYTGSKTAEWRIVPHKAKVEVGDVIKAYDGTTDLPDDKISLVSAAGSAGYQAGLPLPLSEGNGFELTDAKYDSADASETEKNISFTIKLTDTNYTFEDGTNQMFVEMDGAGLDDHIIKIEQATVKSPAEITQYVYNDAAKTYTLNLASLRPQLTLPCEYGTTQYQGCNYDFTDGNYLVGTDAISVSKEGILTLRTVAVHSSDVNQQIGTITVPVVTTNYQWFEFTIKVYISERIPLNASGVTVSASEITYGQTLSDSKITGKMKDGNKEVTGTFAWKDGTIKPNAGSYDAEWTFTPAAGYEEYASVTGQVKVTVKPKNIKDATVTLESDSFVYDTTEKAPTITEVKLAGWSEEITYDIVSGGKATDANDKITLTIRGNGNYTGMATAEWKITPKTVTPSIEVASCSYTGEELKPTVTLKDDLSNTIDPKEYEVSYSNNTTAGTGTVTIKDATGGNYVLGTTSATFIITKAAAPTTIPGSLTITNGLHKTYSFDLSTLLPTLTAPCDYGKITYDKKIETNLGKGAFMALVDGKTGKLTLEVFDRSGTDEGQFGTITVTISTGNYQDIPLTINVSAKNKLTPVLDGELTATDITYGQALNDSKITGPMKNGSETVVGIFTWVDGTVEPAASDSYQAGWKFTPTNQEKYAEVTGTVTIKVNKAATTGEPKYTAITIGNKTLKDAALTTEGSTLNPKDGKLEWVNDKGNVLPDDTRVEANTIYKWRFTPTNTNYTTLTGEVELYHKSSSGGGSGSSSGSYTITVKDAQNGDVTTDRKSASAGTTVTITVKPDSGYVLDDLTVTDSKGNDLKLTGKGGGKYTFTMPSGKVTVEASFAPAKSENPFTDVPSGAYYEDAVAWAVKNGITGGTSATTFDPNGFCTRAQAVTFLWRAAGSPAPKSTAMPFTDVPAGSYYYDAVLWAIENDVTKGTSDTAFSPNANCSRGQIVTFLWRSQKSPDAAAANPFTDVAADAYYTSAVLWAVEKSITGGTSAATFSPSANCTRAQIVTFIYRCMK